MPEDVGYARRDYRGVEGAVDDADPTPKAGVKSSKVVRRSNGVTVAQALKSERKPASDEGARSFGAPLGTESERQREGQSTDSNQ